MADSSAGLRDGYSALRVEVPEGITVDKSGELDRDKMQAEL